MSISKFQQEDCLWIISIGNLFR